MLIVQPCSDNVHLIDPHTVISISRDRVEYDLADAFLRLSQKQDILFITGPGSFTNLRVSALIINMYRHLVYTSFRLYSIDKISLYAFLVVKKILPPQGIVYIGQTKNFWLYDFIHSRYLLVGENYTPDGDYFVDQLSATYFDHMADKKISISADDTDLVVSWQGNTYALPLQKLPLQSVDSATPHYMIEPIIG